MAFTEENLREQVATLEQLREELGRAQEQEKALRKQLGLPEEGPLKVEKEQLPPEVQALVAKAREEAARAGQARAAQSAPQHSGGARPGAGRRGVVRL